MGKKVFSNEENSNEEGNYQKSFSFPSFIYRWIKIVPLIEKLGYFKDHRYQYKHAWIVSENDGHRIKSGLIFMFEMELLLSALLFGVATGIFFATYTQAMQDSIVNYRYDTLEFYIMIFGSMTILGLNYTVICVYLIIQMLLPVSPVNISVWLRSSTMLNLLFIPNFIMATSAYCTVIYVSLVLINCAGGSPIIMFIIFLYGSTTLASGILFGGMGFNLAYLSGSFSSVPIFPKIQSVVNDKSPEECEKLLYNLCVMNKAEGLAENEVEMFYKKIVEKFALDYPEEYKKIIRKEEDTKKTLEEGESEKITSILKHELVCRY